MFTLSIAHILKCIPDISDCSDLAGEELDVEENLELRPLDFWITCPFKRSICSSWAVYISENKCLYINTQLDIAKMIPKVVPLTNKLIVLSRCYARDQKRVIKR